MESRPARTVTCLDHDSTSLRTNGPNDEKPSPEALSTQYDKALQKLYQEELTNAIPEVKNKRLCCCRDLERDNDSREMLKKTFPLCLFYFTMIVGAIQPPNKCSLFLMTGLWILFGGMLAFMLFVGLFTFDLALSCRLDMACQVPEDAGFSLTMIISLLCYFFPTMLSIVLVHTRLRDLLRSREVLTLISIVGPDRIRASRCSW